MSNAQTKTKQLQLKTFASALRKSGNLSEALLWRHIKGRQLNGLSFRRQKVFGQYIVDFYCPERHTVIEIDGVSHSWEKFDYDQKRDSYLRGLGLKIIHITDLDVKQNLEGVVKMLENCIELSGE